MAYMGKESLKRVYICICITDWLCYILETNTTLQINYTQIKIKKKKIPWKISQLTTWIDHLSPVTPWVERFHDSIRIYATAKSLQSCLSLAIPQTAAHQAPPSLGFSRQEHWSGLPFPSPISGSIDNTIQSFLWKFNLLFFFLALWQLY